MPNNEDPARLSERKTGHVNMMVDAVIENISSEGLRAVVREMLASTPSLTNEFIQQAIVVLENSPFDVHSVLFRCNNTNLYEPTPALAALQRRARCYMGCGYALESLRLLCEIVLQMGMTFKSMVECKTDILYNTLTEVDGDIVQGLTAIQKILHTTHGTRELYPDETDILQKLLEASMAVQETAQSLGLEYPFGRALAALKFMTLPSEPEQSHFAHLDKGQTNNKTLSTGEVVTPVRTNRVESFTLGNATVPRIFLGLWQSSSPAWGSASMSNIKRHFDLYLSYGLNAFDMADHYGDAEVIFGNYRSTMTSADELFCATKWAVFHPIKLTEEVVQANIAERCRATQLNSIGLLQFHWQDYDDPQYIQALRWLQADSRIENLGLCNFDTQRMDQILAAGVNVVSNQVQFSLIDSRPIFRMAESCRKHGVKLLTYGTLCGGFLADTWLSKPMPEAFGKGMTPSHRKYLGMIKIWGGWTLFQELLVALSDVSKKHNCSISNIAVRWVLDHDYVGAVIVGARMGVTEHTQENLRVFELTLDDDDRSKIEGVLQKSRRKEVFDAMGDCGAEYRG